MKVCIRRGYHAVYDELINYPPAGVEFVVPKFSSSRRKSRLDWLRRLTYSAVVRALNQPNQVYINPMGCDLIHSCGGMIPLNKEPWVMDVEHAASFVGFEAGRIEKVRKTVEKRLSSKSCKAIMPWSKAGEESMRNALDVSGFEDKMEVVYPAMHLPEVPTKEKSNATRLLFVSVRFETKGGNEVLRAFDRLKKKYDVELTVVSDVPMETQEKHKDVSFFEPNIPREKLLNDFFGQSDVFVLPSFMDTFGLVYLEAMAFGMPCIGSNCFAIPELLEGCGECVDVSRHAWYGKDKLFAWKSWDKFCEAARTTQKPDVIDGIEESMVRLLEDSSLSKRYSREGRKRVEKGRFSLEHRNKAIKRVYGNALDG
ncbi:MAG: glycosyltransferase family 4 protein [Candidatus Diapherotrites archaeon]|nr:glycosyltransferase family 4 protein [Candidatus Diapherotrites archaeon]